MVGYCREAIVAVRGLQERRIIMARRRLHGHVSGFTAAKPMWTCVACGLQSVTNPHADPYTRRTPAPCRSCDSKDWRHSASKAEADRYAMLRMEEKLGQIRNLQHPAPTLLLTVPDVNGWQAYIRSYTADFAYQRLRGDHWTEVVEDHKPRAKLPELTELIHRWVYIQHGIEILVTYFSGRRIKTAPAPSWIKKPEKICA